MGDPSGFVHVTVMELGPSMVPATSIVPTVPCALPVQVSRPVSVMDEEEYWQSAEGAGSTAVA
jgi:hypothetical protein